MTFLGQLGTMHLVAVVPENSDDKTQLCINGRLQTTRRQHQIEVHLQPVMTA